MAARGHRLVMASTRADERAQGFYRRLGYRDAGCLLLREAGYAQPAELFFHQGTEREVIEWQKDTTSP